VNLEGHGREDLFEDVDLTRTVGWFTTIFPVRCSKVNGESVVSTLKRIKEVSRSLPNNGLGYGVLKYLTETDLTQLREPQVSLNYLGQLDAAVPEELGFTAAGESMGPMQSERGARSNLLDFSAAVLGEKLWIGCTYSTNLYERETIEKLTTAFLEALRSLASLRADSPAKAYTPSDFALAQLDERSLTRLISLYPNLEDAYPLSHMQQGMLFHNLYAPDSTTYFLQLGCTFNGSLDIEAFTKAWQGVIARHPILRTAFAWEGLEQPLQIVCAGAEFMLDQANWCDRTPAEQEVEFERLLKQDRIKGFDLTKAPLMRFRLIRTADDCYYFVWNRHHLLMDGWSVPLILKEVFALYAANLKGVDVELEPVRPFRDYIAWLNEQDMQATETFWRDRLRGFTAPTAMGNNAQSGLEESFGELRRQLSAETTQELQAYVRRRQITLNTMLLGVWGIVLSRLGNAGDVVFGTAVSGRPPSLPGVESIVGVFINMLPLRVVLSNESPVTDWLRQLQQQQIEMQQHEFTPLVQIQNWSDVPRGLPLFESVLIFENYPMEEVLAPRKGSLGISNLRSFDRNNYPLNWLIMPGSELLLRLIYNEAHFDSGFMAKTIEQFETVLHLLVKHSELTLGEFLSLVDDNFRQQEARRAGTLEDVGRAKLKNITRRAAQLGI
jgi:non-ribosomal peptide synthase protein (TIGR01720 family)